MHGNQEKMREGFKGSRAPFANSLISMQAERGKRAREKAISSLQTLEAKFFELFPQAVAKLQSMGCFYVYFAQQLHPNQAGAALPKRLSPIFPILTGFLSFPIPSLLAPTVRVYFLLQFSRAFLHFFCNIQLQCRGRP